MRNNGYYDEYCSGQVLDSFILESDHPTGNQNGINGFYSGQVLDSHRLESNHPIGNLSSSNGFCSGQVLDSYRIGLDLPVGCHDGVNLTEHVYLSSRNDRASGPGLPLDHTDHLIENYILNFMK